MNKIVNYKGTFCTRITGKLPDADARLFRRIGYSRNGVLLKVKSDYKIVDSNEISEVTEDFNNGYLYGQAQYSLDASLDSVLANLVTYPTHFINGVIQAFEDLESNASEDLDTEPNIEEPTSPVDELE